MSAFTDLMADDYAEKIYLVEVVGYNTVTDQEETLYYSSQKYTTEPWETPANQHYDPIMSDERLTLFSRSLFSVEASFGQVVLDNMGGDLDYLFDYAFNGRAITVKLGGKAFNYADFGTVLSGVIDQAIFEYDVVRFVVRGNLYKLQVPLNTTTYAGTNSGSTGNEGLADDIKGAPKSLCYGECKNVPITPVNTSAYRYQFHSAGTSSAVDSVYDKGALQTITTDYTNDLTNGIIDLVTTPDGQVTADVKGDATGSGYISTCADIVSRIITTRTVYTTSDLDTSSFTALNTANSAALGVFFPPQEITVLEAITSLMESVGAHIFERRDGLLKVLRFNGVVGSSVASFGVGDITENTFKTVSSDYEVPIYQAKTGYGKNWTVQNKNELAAGVTDARVAYLEQEYRYSAPSGALDATIKDIWLNATIFTKDTLIVNSADADTESIREFNLRSVPHREFELEVKTSAFTIDIGDIITITHPRFGFSAGQDVIITEMKEDTRNSTAMLKVFL